MADKKSGKNSSSPRPPVDSAKKNTAVNIETAGNTKAVKSSSGAGTVKSDAKKAPKQNKVAKYFKDLKSEFKKVVWPSKKTVINNTGVVLIVMIICGVGIFGLDSAFAALLKGLLSLAGS